MKRATLLQRLTLSYILLIVLLLVMVGAAIVPQQLHELQSSLDAQIMGTAADPGRSTGTFKSKGGTRYDHETAGQG